MDMLVKELKKKGHFKPTEEDYYMGYSLSVEVDRKGSQLA